MRTQQRLKAYVFLLFCSIIMAALFADPRAGAQDKGGGHKSSFMPVIEEPFEVVQARDKAARPRVMAAARKLLEERYDLRRRVDENVRMTHGKPISVVPTARLKNGVTWEQLANMSPEEVREKGLFPYLPLPHINHAVGGMVFPQMHTKVQPRLERFDMEFDIPEQFLPEFPPAIFLTTRPDLGD